jgi:hypothetical protein
MSCYIRSSAHCSAVTTLLVATALAIIAAPLPWQVVHPHTFIANIDVKYPAPIIIGTIDVGVVPVAVTVSASTSLVSAKACYTGALTNASTIIPTGTNIIDQCEDINQDDCKAYLSESQCTALVLATILALSAIGLGITATVATWFGCCCFFNCGNHGAPMVALLTAVFQLVALVIRKPQQDMSVPSRTENMAGMEFTTEDMTQHFAVGTGYWLEIMSCVLFFIGSVLAYQAASAVCSAVGAKDDGNNKLEPLLATDNYNRL